MLSEICKDLVPLALDFCADLPEAEVAAITGASGVGSGGGGGTGGGRGAGAGLGLEKHMM